MKEILINSFARIFRVNSNVLKAIIETESRGAGFVDGKLKIRFELHIFINQLGYELSNVFLIKNKIHYYKQDCEWKYIHDSQETEYAAFEIAKSYNENAAYESVSMGLGQVMGFNYKRLGYDSAKEMFDEFSKGEIYQITGMLSYIANTINMVNSIRNKDWDAIALLYNGSGNIEYYSGIIKNEYNKLIN